LTCCISSATSADSQVLGIPRSASSKRLTSRLSIQNGENICDPRSRPTQARVYSCLSPKTPKQQRQHSSFGTPIPGPTSVDKTSGIRPPSSGTHRRTVLSPHRKRSESASSGLQCRTGMFAYMSVTGRDSPPNAKPSALKPPSPGLLFTLLPLCSLLHPPFHPPTSISLFPRTKRCETLVCVKSAHVDD
jgi:hypothetical protein